MFTHENFLALHSSRLGVMCRSANFRCVSTVFFEGSSSNSFGEHEADCTVQAGKM